MERLNVNELARKGSTNELEGELKSNPQRVHEFELWYIHGGVPLHFAAWNGRTNTAEMLLRYGAFIDYANEEGETPLFCASVDGHADTIEMLLKCGANIHITESNDGLGPLHVSTGNGHFEATATLIRYGADVNSQNNYGETPLHFSSRNNWIDVTELLLRSGAKINSQDYAGKSPLHNAASEEERTEIVEILLQHFAQTDLQDEDGNTPLHLSLFEGNLETSKILLKYGANIHIPGRSGYSSHDLIMKDRYFKPIYDDWLKGQEILISSSSKSGSTPAPSMSVQTTVETSNPIQSVKLSTTSNKESSNNQNVQINLTLSQSEILSLETFVRELHDRTLTFEKISSSGSTPQSLQRIDPRLKFEQIDISEQLFLKRHSNLWEFYIGIQRIFNDAFLYSFAFLTGKFEVTKSTTSQAMSVISSVVGSTSLPFASMVFMATGAIADQVTHINRTARYSNLSDLVPDHDPYSSSRFAEAIARRLAITEQERLKSLKSLHRYARLKRLLSIRNFIERYIGEYATQGIMCDTGKLSCEQLLAYEDAKICLEFILSGKLSASIAKQKILDYQNIDNIVKLIIEGALGISVIGKSVSKLTNKLDDFHARTVENTNPFDDDVDDDNGHDASSIDSVQSSIKDSRSTMKLEKLEKLEKELAEMKSVVKVLEGKNEIEKTKSTALDHIIGGKLQAQSRDELNKAVEAFYTGNTPFYQRQACQLEIITEEVLLLKENAGHGLDETAFPKPHIKSQQNSCQGKLSVSEMAKRIRDEMSFDPEMSIRDAINRVSDLCLDAHQIDKLKGLPSISEKLQFLIKVLGIAES